MIGAMDIYEWLNVRGEQHRVSGNIKKHRRRGRIWVEVTGTAWTECAIWSRLQAVAPRDTASPFCATCRKLSLRPPGTD